MPITSAWTTPSTLDRNVGDVLSEAIWDNLVSNELYLWDTLHNYQRAASILSINLGASDVTLARGAAGQLNLGAYLTRTSPVGNLILDSYVSGDTAERFSLTVGGVHGWGSGAIAQDTNLYREAADVLHTDDSFVAVGEVQAARGLATQIAMGAKGPAGESGIVFGSAVDTNLYRAGANTLKTDDNFVALTVSAPNVWTRLGETVLASPASSVGFGSIPATYRHLKLLIQTRATGAVNGTELRIRVNSDGGSNYTSQYHWTWNATVEASGPATTTQGIIGTVPGTTGLASFHAVAEVTIADYAGAYYKSMISSFHGQSGSSAIYQAVGHAGCFWSSTVAINRVDVFVASGNLDTGTVVSLYAM